jgi:WD40 repeat protein
VSVWKLDPGAQAGDPERFPPHQPGGLIVSLAFGPRGRFLAVASAGRNHNSVASSGSRERGRSVWNGTDGDGAIRIFDLSRKMEIVPQETFHRREVTNVSFSPDGRFLAIGTEGSTCYLRSLVADNPTQGYSVGVIGHDQPGRCFVAFSPDGARFATAGRDGTVRIWDLKSVIVDPSGAPVDSLARAIRLRYSGINQFIQAVAFSPDGRALASSSGVNARLSVDPGLDPTSTEPRLLDPGPLGAATFENGVAFDPRGRWLAAGPIAGNLCLWRLPREAEAAPLILPLGEAFRDGGAICYSPSGRLLAAAGKGKVVKIWDVSGDRIVPDPLYDHRLELEGPPVAIAINGDESLLAIGMDEGLGVWKLSRGVPPVRCLSLKESLLRPRGTIGFDPQGRLVVLSGCGMRLYHLEIGPPGPSTASIVRESEGSYAALSPGGRYVFCGSVEDLGLIWDLRRERPESRPFTLRAFGAGEAMRALDPHGQWIAAANANDIFLSRLTAADVELEGLYDKLKLRDDMEVGEMIGLARWRVSRDLDEWERTYYFPNQDVGKTFPDPP